MPIYEFRCTKCRARFSKLVRGFTAPAAPVCPRCGDTDAERLISTFAYHRSAKDIQEDSGPPSMENSPDFYNDPRNVGRWTEQQFKQMGVEVPPEVQEKIEAARDGETPDKLEETSWGD